MNGDRKHDIIGASNTGNDSIGATYGYSSYEELSHSNPTSTTNEFFSCRTGCLLKGSLFLCT